MHEHPENQRPEHPPTSWKDRLYVAFSGAVMGAADVVPGVSGGTMAFILGVYEELLDAIRSFDFTCLRLVFSGRFKAAFEHVHGPFLCALGIGLAAAILTLARVVTWLYAHHPVHLFAFFFGLVVASIVTIGGHIRWRWITGVAVAIGTVIAYRVVTLAPVETVADPLTLLWAGAIAIMAMILPGISGSFILLILGLYHAVMEGVKGLDPRVLIPFAVGAAGGLLVSCRILSWLLKRWHQPVVAFLVGFMVGSLWKIWPFRRVLETVTTDSGKVKVLRDTAIMPDWGSAGFWFALGLALIGCGLVLGIERWQRRLGAARGLGG